MPMIQSWRWFGPKDPISLEEIKQTGAAGIVTALHQIPVGEVWEIKDIAERKAMVESYGLKWVVAESLPVHENIKKRKDNYRKLIDNYKLSLKNLGSQGISIVCYNFMPVLDWSRTDLNVRYSDGSITTKFDFDIFAAFDLFILQRKNAENNYTEAQITKARQIFDNFSEEDKNRLTGTVLLGLPGSLEAYTLEEFRNAISEYENVAEEQLRNNLYDFIREIIPAAEEAGIHMAIHPDDPPFSLLGLPRIVSTQTDVEKILNAHNSESNGITLCTGSFGAGYKNNLVDITCTFADRINFVHLRNVKRNEAGDFLEENHLDGDVDIYGVMKAVLLEQKRRLENGRKDVQIPFRPDHGHLMKPDENREGIYPGYSLFGRMRGLAELRGMEMGIIKSLGLE